MLEPHRSVVFLMVAAALAGCGTSESSGPTSTVRDSAGITIVESTGPSWAEGEAWTLSAEPVLDIGVDDGPPEYQLYRVLAGARQADGTIVIANTGSHELRWYDADGTFLRSAGGEGEGPGEFTSVRWIGLLPGDSVLAYDLRQRRFSVFDPAGEYIRSTTLHAPMHFADDIFADGSMLMSHWESMQDGVDRRMETVSRFGLDGTLRDTIAVLASTEMEQNTVHLGGGSVGMTLASLAFSHEAVVATSGLSVYAGTQDRYAIDVLDTTGVLLTSIRMPGDPQPVTESLMDAYLDEQVADEPEAERAARRAQFAERAHAPTVPAHGSLLVDAEGNLWVEVYRLPGDDQPRWTVFDPEHRMLGEVHTPRGFRLFAIGGDYVLGRWVDPDLGVEHVRVYGLEKP